MLCSATEPWRCRKRDGHAGKVKIDDGIAQRSTLQITGIDREQQGGFQSMRAILLIEALEEDDLPQRTVTDQILVIERDRNQRIEMPASVCPHDRNAVA